MSTRSQVVLLSLLPGLGNFAGGMVAEFVRSSPRLLTWALHAAAGIVIAIVSVELIPKTMGALGGVVVRLRVRGRRARLRDNRRASAHPFA